MNLNRPIRALLRVVPVILAGLGIWSAHAASSSEPIRSGRARLWADEVKEAIRDRTPRRNGTVQEQEFTGSGSATRGGSSGPLGSREATGSTGGSPSGRGSNSSGNDGPDRSRDRGNDASGGNQNTSSGGRGSETRGGDHRGNDASGGNPNTASGDRGSESRGGDHGGRGGDHGGEGKGGGADQR
jgi:hypothetical protein